ncbi:MAG: hypothetical protein M3235_00365 [Actinomycetota bacterium]|nr:hypothetical protein [Actinomycetota bacterium]
MNGRLRVRIGSVAGLRSQIWTVVTAGDRGCGVSVGPEHDPCPTSRVRSQCGWTIYLPDDTGAHYELEDRPAAPELGRFLGSPAPGWHVGVVLLIPAVALAARPGGTGTGVVALPTPPPGRCSVVTVLLGDPHCAALGDAAARAPGPFADTGSLLAACGQVQVWRGQTILAPELSRHIIRTRQRLAEIAPAEPRRLPAYSRFHADSGIDGCGVDVVIDLGSV